MFIQYQVLSRHILPMKDRQAVAEGEQARKDIVPRRQYTKSDIAAQRSIEFHTILDISRTIVCGCRDNVDVVISSMVTTKAHREGDPPK